MLRNSRNTVDTDNGLVIGSYGTLLIRYEPLATMCYGISFVVSRLTILAVFYHDIQRHTLGE
ncbi:hypothetical protein GCM10009000_100800 [Halobacterium noricense]